MKSEMEEFNALFSEYRERFVRFAASYLSDSIAAEDVVMESFISYWERRHTLKPGSNPAAYILGSVRNKCLNHLRARGIRQKAGEEIRNHNQRVLQTRIATLEACDPESIYSDEATSLVNKTIESLPEKTRQVFTRSRSQDMSYREIASEMGITEKVVEFEISKALKTLRIALKDYILFFPLLF